MELALRSWTCGIVALSLAFSVVACGDENRLVPTRVLLASISRDSARFPTRIVYQPSELVIVDTAAAKMATWPRFPNDYVEALDCYADMQRLPLPLEDCEKAVALTATKGCGWIRGDTYVFLIGEGKALFYACQMGEWHECDRALRRKLVETLSTVETSTSWGGRDFCSFNLRIADANGVQHYSFVALRPEIVERSDRTIRQEGLRRQHNALVRLINELSETIDGIIQNKMP